MRTKPVCSYCASDDVCADAIADWDPETQTWETFHVYDSGLCRQCGEQNKYFTFVKA